MPSLTVLSFILLYLILSTFLLIYLQTLYSPNSPLLLTSFLHGFTALNFMISVWEISLGKYLRQVQATAATLHQRHGKSGALEAVGALFSLPLSLEEAVTLKTWHIVWATYSLYDNSYANEESFGFFIDVGNGWTTIVPMAVFSLGLIFGVGEANVAMWACLCLCSFYQMMYGTLIYLLSYIYNRRHDGFGTVEVVLFVALTNAIWVIMPLVGIGVCYQVLKTGSMEIVRGA